jgi:hypothetical protein
MIGTPASFSRFAADRPDTPPPMMMTGFCFGIL